MKRFNSPALTVRAYSGCKFFVLCCAIKHFSFHARSVAKPLLKINPNVTRADSLENYLALSLTDYCLHAPLLPQVITVVWRLWWLGGQMWTWTFLTWAQRSIQPASAKSWSVPGSSWGKVSVQHRVTLHRHTDGQTHTQIRKHSYCAQARMLILWHIWMKKHLDANTQ